MEDFRYFDAVRREREDKLIVLNSTLAIFQIWQSQQVTDFAALQAELLPFKRSGRRAQPS